MARAVTGSATWSIVARAVATPAEQVAVPAAVVIAVHVGISEVVVTIVLGVGVGLLERELAASIVLRGMRAVGGIAAPQVPEGWRGEVRYGRAGAEARRGAMVIVPVVAAGGCHQHRRGDKASFQCHSDHEIGRLLEAWTSDVAGRRVRITTRQARGALAAGRCWHAIGARPLGPVPRLL